MMYTFCTNKAQWEEKTADASFLQSWEWGAFQAKMGNPVFRLILETGRYFQGFERKRGPLTCFVIPHARLNLADMPALRAFAKEREYAYIHVDLDENSEVPAAKFGSVTHVTNEQPQYSSVLDITQSDEDLLKHMHRKTRYNIRLAGKKGVTVTQEKNTDVFLQLLDITTKRDAFRGHAHRYYQAMNELPFIKQFTAWYNGEPLASALAVQHGGKMIYLHGASSDIHRSVMAPYLVQWEMIQYGKEHGATHYDFWGIAAPAKGKNISTHHTYEWDPQDTLHGVTRFKAGFGGERLTYPTACRIITKPTMYYLYLFARILLRKKRL